VPKKWIKVINGLLSQVRAHLDKIRAEGPDDPDFSHHISEVSVMLIRAERLAQKRLKGRSAAQILSVIEEFAEVLKRSREA